MGLSIYKKGQGYWTRLMTAIAAGLIIFMGAWWLWQHLELIDYGDLPQVYVGSAAALLFVIVFGWVTYWLIGTRRKSVDFLIATEGEMKKVNWSTRREIAGSTVVVILFAALITLFCWAFDKVFFFFFVWIRVLDVPTTS